LRPLQSTDREIT